MVQTTNPALFAARGGESRSWYENPCPFGEWGFKPPRPHHVKSSLPKPASAPDNPAPLMAGDAKQPLRAITSIMKRTRWNYLRSAPCPRLTPRQEGSDRVQWLKRAAAPLSKYHSNTGDAGMSRSLLEIQRSDRVWASSASGRDRPGERPCIGKCRNSCACLCDCCRVEIGENHARTLSAIGEHAPPGVDRQRMSPGVALAAGRRAVAAPLRGGEHVRPGLDRPRPQKNLPMRAPGRHGEGGGHGQHPCPFLGQRTVERWKAEIIADRQAKREILHTRQYGLPARPESLGFAITLLAAKIDIEHVDLVIARHDRTFRVDQELPVEETLIRPVIRFQRERSDREPDPKLSRQFAKPRKRRIPGLGMEHAFLMRPATGDDVRILRRQHKARATCGCLADEAFGDRQVRRRIIGDVQLDKTHPHHASNSSSLPVRSSI